MPLKALTREESLALTDEEKHSKYENFQYSFPAPPVCHVNWGTEDWINFIDSKGKWYKEVEPIAYKQGETKHD